jgi:hypothetical protein
VWSLCEGVIFSFPPKLPPSPLIFHLGNRHKKQIMIEKLPLKFVLFLVFNLSWNFRCILNYVKQFLRFPSHISMLLESMAISAQQMRHLLVYYDSSRLLWQRVFNKLSRWFNREALFRCFKNRNSRCLEYALSSRFRVRWC